LKQRRQFPICLLETKAQGDENRNIDPIFRIVAWSDRSNFAELLPPPPEEGAAAIAYSPPKAAAMNAPRVAELINDDVPF
jgi:hypothetical protein